MKIFIFTFSLLTLLSCSTRSNSDLLQENSKTASFYNITEVARDYYDVVSQSRKRGCGDDNYWKVVKLGKDAVPFLIAKVESTELTSIKNPCSDEMLTEGVLAFILLEEILDIPLYLVFQIQYDFLTGDCIFPSGLLESVEEEPVFFHTKLTEWYEKVKDNYHLVELDSETKTECHEKFGVTHVLRNEQ